MRFVKEENNMKKRRIRAKTARYLEGSLFIAPWLIGFLLFLAFPLGFSLFMSFQQVNYLPTGLQYEFNGINYYREILFNSSEFYELRSEERRVGRGCRAWLER